MLNVEMIFPTWILDNIFRYVKSRDDKQLRSKAAENDVGSCSPEDYTPNDKGHKPIVPCGLIAWSLFNDTYKLSSNNKDLMINKKNIAWTSDQKGNLGPKNFQAGGLIGGARLNESLPVNISSLLNNLYLYSLFSFKRIRPPLLLSSFSIFTFNLQNCHLVFNLFLFSNIYTEKSENNLLFLFCRFHV